MWKSTVVILVVSILLLGATTQAQRLDITKPGDTIVGVPNDNDWPGNEAPPLAIDDNTATKYLHFKGDFDPDPGTGGTGFRVTPSAAQTIVVGLTFTTANDAQQRDPAAFEIYGSNVSIDGPYELIASGDIVDFTQATAWPRFTKNETPIVFDNDVAYDHYQLLITDVRDRAGGNSMQVAEIELLGMSTVALSPTPADGALLPATWVSLSWLPGDFGITHDLYLSDNFDAVNGSTADAFRGNQATTDYIIGFPGFPFPDGLVPGTTYYWRVDDVEADGVTKHTGKVWSFMIPPKTAYSPDPINGAEFVELDATLGWTPGFDAKLHTVYFGDNFDDVNNAAGGFPQGNATYPPTGPLEAEKVYYWRVDEFDIAATHKGDVWSFTTPGAIGNPQPANGAVDVSMIATLSWTPAETAASSDLYFGTDADAVKNATAASPEYIGNKALGSESHDPGKLAFNANYYWRADAVYADKTVKGLVWSFATADFIAVDDFEAYNDIDPPQDGTNRIFDKWIDGFGTTTNGALVGNDLPPYAGQTVVHGGAQSMPYFYDNNLKTSEATLTLVYPRDWTEEGSANLSLWFRGNTANAAERMYVALNNTAVVYHDDPAATQLNAWTQWVIPLQAFADLGVNLTDVNTITIGLGTKNSPAAGGTGTMYFDDIRLYR